MSINWEKNIELINKQIKGQLTSEEERSFGIRMGGEPEFVRLYQDTQLASDAIRLKVMKRNFEQLQQLEKSLPAIDLEERAPKKIWPIWRNWSMAAGFLLMVTAGLYFWENETITTNTIFVENFKSYPTFEIDRGDMDITLKKKTYALYNEALYAEEKFPEAIAAFKELTAKENEAEDFFFLGMTYLNNNQLSNAIETLSQLKEAPLKYQVLAKWYSALAYIKQGDKDKAKLLLEEIITNYPENSYATKSAAILKKLEKAE